MLTPPSSSSKEKVSASFQASVLRCSSAFIPHPSSHLFSDFPANNIVKFLLGFTNKGPENFVVDSLDASFRYPQVRKDSVGHG